ncbi:hypothetical protein CBM2587_B100131 [Cupriavidus taiwanensis]|uniref:Uncharacterized protein n=1 Tax=Cupriavidus taiwanensis TaxID=164546 RepID=A0A975X8D3_9BURK|nr:hypothetical protein CBM2587_B100131 [Cupriavidus taiwanensis]
MTWRNIRSRNQLLPQMIIVSI